jgi:molybdopterin biosynthesis enzyme
MTAGADLILTTAGMSVDPDDVTREGIRRAGGNAACYGAPILPGAMFLAAEVAGVPVLGVPACGLFHQTTILDLILPRILAGERMTRDELAGMGHGGLCLNCPDCQFPRCPFGK